MNGGLKVLVSGSIDNASTKFAEVIADEWLADNWVICPVANAQLTEDEHAARWRRLIDRCDEVLVVVVNGYIGPATAQEIAYAEQRGKKIRYRTFTITRENA